MNIVFLASGVLMICFAGKISKKIRQIHSPIYKKIYGDWIDLSKPFWVKMYMAGIIFSGLVLICGSYALTFGPIEI